MPRRKPLGWPRYMVEKRLRGAVGYYWQPPTWAKDRGCTMHAQALGTDYAEAKRQCDEILNPQFDAWRTGGASEPSRSRPLAGTFDWLASLYRSSRQFRELDRKTRKLREAGLRLVADHRLKDGRRFGDLRLPQITPGVVDALYEKLIVAEDGRERRTTINHAMKSCRRAWFVAKRISETVVPAANPFSKMGLKSSDRVTPTATWDDLSAFVHACDGEGLSSLGTAALVTWEWLQREEHVFGHFEAAHYRPKERPDAVRVVHPKTGEEAWVPLFDEDGEPLYPELMARLDAIKRERIGGLMLVRDWKDEKAGVPVPWVTPSGDLTYMRHTVKRLILKAGLPENLSFTSFRHGGLTEAGDADLTDSQIRAVSRQKSPKVMPRYIKPTLRQIAQGVRKRRAVRTNHGRLSE